MSFDPDEYLKKKDESAFNPDAFLNKFDPDAYLGEPQSSALVDMTKRVGRGISSGVAQVAAAGARLSDAWAGILPNWAKRYIPPDEQHPLDALSAGAKQVAASIPVDPARNEELKSKLAEGAGAAVPVMAAAAINPVAGVVTAAGQLGEAERDAALAAGDTPEIAAEKAKIGRLGGAVMGIVPAGPVRAVAGVGERIATRAITGAAINAAQDAALQQAVDQHIDWGRVKVAGAFGVGLGLVLGVPEALALRKALKTVGGHEGKTLGQAITDISAETGEPVTDLQRRINEAVGVKPPPTEAESAVRQSDAEITLGDRARAEEGVVNAATAEQAQAASLLEQRAQRAQDFDEAVEARNPGYRQWWADVLAAEDQTKQSPQGARRLGAALSAEQLAAEQGSRLDQRPSGGAAVPMLMAGEGSPDIRLVDATPPSDPLGGRMTPPVEIDVGQGGTVRPAWERAVTAPPSIDVYAGSGISNKRSVEPKYVPGDFEQGGRHGRNSAPNKRTGAQGGFITPDVLLPVARSAVGGLLGYATGDTPEERVRNALLGMGFGVLASPSLVKRLTAGVLNAPVSKSVAALAEERMTALRLRMAPQSLLPHSIRTQLRWGEQASAAVIQTGLSLSRDLEHTINSSGNIAARAALAPAVKDYLEGRTPAVALPPPVRVAAEKVRNYVDMLSDRAVAEGVVTGQMADTFLSGRGNYLRRSYEIFLNPNYRPTPAAISNAIAAVQRANGVSTAEAEAVVAGILDKNGRANLPDFLMGRGKVAGKDVSSVVRRHDLLPEVRALLGEVKDPILAVNQTIPRLARLIEHDATQRQVRAIGTKLGLFSEQRSLAHPTPLVADSSATHDVLSGLFASPEIATAFQKEAGSGRTAFVPDVLWKTWTSATSIAKSSKTVFNPESYAPNFLGGIIANIGNANMRYNHSARGLALGAEELGALRQFMPRGSNRDALRTELGELKKLGIIGQSVNAGDLLRTIESSFFGKLKGTSKGVLAAPFKVYGAIDDFNRYIAWQSERARYTKAFPSMGVDEIKRHAAEVVRATTPNYSEVPKAVKQLSVAALMPNFVNFTWEVFRNTKNSVQIGLRDLQQGRVTGNAGLIRAGAERLAAITAVTAAGSMWGVSKLSRESNNITDAQDKAVRFFSPTWNKSGVLAYHSPAGAGKPVQFSNLSYLVPHALLFQAIEAGIRGADEGKMASEFLGALNEQFGLGSNVLLPGLIGALSGRDVETGRSIPKTAVDPTVSDRAAYLYDQAFEPLVMKWNEKWQHALKNEKGEYGRVYSTTEQLNRLAGVRAQTLDPVQAVAWKARELGNALQEAGDIYRLQVKRQLPADELEKFYGKANEARKQQFEEMRTMLSHARTLGVSDEQTIASLRASRVGPEVILGVLDGRYPPLEKGKAKTLGDIVSDLRARPMQQRQAALAQIYREDPALGREVVSRMAAVDRGRTEHDKLLLGLSVSDGSRAAYLRQKLSDIGDVAARRLFMLELRRKGILTDRVMQQMAAPTK